MGEKKVLCNVRLNICVERLYEEKQVLSLDSDKMEGVEVFVKKNHQNLPGG